MKYFKSNSNDLSINIFMKLKIIQSKILTILFLTILLSSCKSLPGADARKVSPDPKDRVAKNIEEGRGFRLSNTILGGSKGGDFEFASSNELWRASLDTLDFMPLALANYSGGIIVTDWYSDDNSSEESVKISIRFLSNEIRADGLKIIIHEKICNSTDTKDCQIQKIDSEINNQIKLAILKKASIYKEQGDKSKSDEVKKYRKGSKTKKLGKTPKDYN